MYNGELYRRLTSSSSTPGPDLATLGKLDEPLFDSQNHQSGGLDYLPYDFSAPSGFLNNNNKPGATPMDTDENSSLEDFSNYAAMSPMKDFLEDLGVGNPGSPSFSSQQLLNQLNNNHLGGQHGAGIAGGGGLGDKFGQFGGGAGLPGGGGGGHPEEIKFLVGDVNEDASRRLLVTFYRVVVAGREEDDAYQCQVKARSGN